MNEETSWERCAGMCGREFRPLALCHAHRLCGSCHYRLVGFVVVPATRESREAAS